MTLPLLHPQVLACATCLVDPGSAIYQAQQGAVFFMLAVVFLMLGTLAFIFLNFARKQRRALAAQAGPAQP